MQYNDGRSTTQQIVWYLQEQARRWKVRTASYPVEQVGQKRPAMTNCTKPPASIHTTDFHGPQPGMYFRHVSQSPFLGSACFHDPNCGAVSQNHCQHEPLPWYACPSPPALSPTCILATHITYTHTHTDAAVTQELWLRSRSRC